MGLFGRFDNYLCGKMQHFEIQSYFFPSLYPFCLLPIQSLNKPCTHFLRAGTISDNSSCHVQLTYVPRMVNVLTHSASTAQKAGNLSISISQMRKLRQRGLRQGHMISKR